MSKVGTNGIPLCPHCGAEATGTVDTLVGLAPLGSIRAGHLLYRQKTEIDWDTQQPNKNEQGELQWWCAGCHESFFAPLPSEPDVSLAVPTLEVERGFRPVGETDPQSRLLATLLVNGVEHHLEAYEVREGKDGQEGVDDFNEQILLEVAAAVGTSGPWKATDIGGRAYVLVMTPFCD